MIDIQIDKQMIETVIREEVRARIKKADMDLVYWDRAELERRTCLSWNSIQEKFFYDARFPKHKVGGKWLFPAEKTKDFLLEWLEEQN
mgnify:FL=1